MRKQWVIPDIHGYAKTLRCLVEERLQPAVDDDLYFLGDYIDRGPDSKGVIDYIRQLQEEGLHITPLRGNHEDFLVQVYDRETSSGSGQATKSSREYLDAWYGLGGVATLASFKVPAIVEIPSHDIEWIRNLPFYVKLEDFVLVHAGLNFRNKDPYADEQAMLWIRHYETVPGRIGNRRIIHGHTPQILEWILHVFHDPSALSFNLDNGPYLNRIPGYGNLLALELTAWELVIQENKDVVR